MFPKKHQKAHNENSKNYYCDLGNKTAIMKQ